MKPVMIYGKKFNVSLYPSKDGVFTFCVFDKKGNPTYKTTNGTFDELKKYLDIEEFRAYI